MLLSLGLALSSVFNVSPSTPVVVLGMPKSGTSSIRSFFSCGGYRTSHWGCHTKRGTESCGSCFDAAFASQMSPFRECGNYEAYTQIDMENPPCHFPQIGHLSRLVALNATFILNLRPARRWLRSVTKWNDMRSRLTKCKNVGLPKPASDVDFVNWYTNHTRDVLKAVKYLPHIVVDIEGPTAQETLSAAFNISHTCWGHHNRNHS